MLQTASLPNRIKEFYERVSVERGAALEDLPNLYADQRALHQPGGRSARPRGVSRSLGDGATQYKVFRFHDIEVIGTDEQFSLTYSMTIAFGFGPDFTTDMATLCRASDGKVDLSA